MNSQAANERSYKKLYCSNPSCSKSGALIQRFLGFMISMCYTFWFGLRLISLSLLKILVVIIWDLELDGMTIGVF